MNKTTAIIAAIILIGMFTGSANACEPFVDLDKVGCFDDTPNYPLVNNYGIWGWAGNNTYSGKNYSYNFSWGGHNYNWSNWNWGSWGKNWTNNYSWKWNFCKWNDKPCNGGGEIPEPTCTVLTLAGTGILCLLRRKK